MLARRTREKCVLVKAALRRFPDVRRKNPVRTADEQDPHVSRACEEEGSGIAFSHESGGRCASCARRKRKQLSRYAQAPLQAEALQSAANTRKHKNCSEKTEDGSKLCFLRWICETRRGVKCGRKPLSGGVPRWIYQPLRDCRMQPPGGNPCKQNFFDTFAKPCEIIKCSRKVAQLLPSRVSSMHLRRTAGPTNAVAKRQPLPGGVPMVHLRNLCGTAECSRKVELLARQRSLLGKFANPYGTVKCSRQVEPLAGR